VNLLVPIVPSGLTNAEERPRLGKSGPNSMPDVAAAIIAAFAAAAFAVILDFVKVPAFRRLGIT
jgi:hypothetical protein